MPLPAGTGIGWCNFKMLFQNGNSLTYLTSYSFKKRFSIEAPKIFFIIIYLINLSSIRSVLFSLVSIDFFRADYVPSIPFV